MEFLIVDSGADIKSMNDYYDEFLEDVEAGNVMVTGQEINEEGFDTVGGTSEGSASAVPVEELQPDDAAETVE